MYRCKDCKLEYARKPDYCDCGNDSFEKIVQQEPQKEEVEKAVIEENIAKKSFFEQYPEAKRFVSSLDILSTSIFVICLILSILAWIFIGKENPNVKHGKKAVKQTQEKVENKKEMPDLDSFWNNATPSVKKPVEEEQTQEPAIATPVAQQNGPRESQQPTAPKINNPPQSSNVAKPKISAKKSSKSNGAMTTYKGALRQALFSKLAVTSVQGTGRCDVEFSVDKNGKLLNRKFSKLSDNKSLNDAVYNMLMSLPQYYPPPADYNGEKFRLSFYFDNGYYEVSY